MVDLLVLGTAASVPDARHDTIGLMLRGPDWAVLVECGGSPLYRLAQSGRGLNQLHALIVTHGHADHLYGLPMLAQGLWLGGRETSLPIYGPAQALAQGRELLEMFDLLRAGERFKVSWQAVPLREGQPLFNVEGVRITASPGAHSGQDSVGLRFDNTTTGRSIVYSSDTQPCPAIVRLSTGADLLIHEATGGDPGHSTPEQAGEVARQAKVKRLVLIHYPVAGTNLEELRGRAAAAFPGPVALAQDGDLYSF
jgi:ribonuclease Z